MRSDGKVFKCFSIMGILCIFALLAGPSQGYAQSAKGTLNIVLTTTLF